MLSTNLREVSQCLEKAPTRTFPYWERLLLRPLNLLGGSLTALVVVSPLVAPAMFHLVPPSCVSSPASQYQYFQFTWLAGPVPPPSWPGGMAAAVLVLHPAQPLHLPCDQHPGLGEPPADLPHQHAPLGQTQHPVLTDICLLVNIINVVKTQNQKLWQITLRWWLRRNVFQSKHWFKYLYVYFLN